MKTRLISQEEEKYLADHRRDLWSPERITCKPRILCKGLQKYFSHTEEVYYQSALSKGMSKEQTSTWTKMFLKGKSEVQIGSKDSDKHKDELYGIWLYKMIIVSSVRLKNTWN